MSCMDRLFGLLAAFIAIFAGFQIHFSGNPAVSIWWDIKAPVVRWIGIPLALWGLWFFIYVMRDIIRKSNKDDDKNT